MAHELETSDDGRTAFVSAKIDAWHQLGTVVDHTMTADGALNLAHLSGWNVRKEAMFTGPDLLEVPDSYAIVRDNPFTTGQIDVLSTAGNAYHPIQNEEHAALLDALVDEAGAHFETAGSINGGRRVFVTMKLPGYMSIGGVDKIENYIAAINSHDGSMRFTIMTTPVRIVCQNTLNMAMADNKGLFQVRHTMGAKNTIVSEARKALDLTFTYLEDFQAEAERLINTPLTDKRFEEIIEAEFGVPSDAHPSAITRSENKKDEFFELFALANTHEGIRNTAWAGANALIEWADHHAPVHGDDTGRRAFRSVFDPSFKQRALSLFQAA